MSKRLCVRLCWRFDGAMNSKDGVERGDERVFSMKVYALMMSILIHMNDRLTTSKYDHV